VISATNGKTTTAAMVASILARTGVRLVHNRAGANMAGGVAAALAASRGDMGLFEVDEFWLGPMAAELDPRAVLLSNLFRDQLDRYGELEIIADRWAEIVAGLPEATALVLNADDPLVADLGRHRDALFFGVEDDALALPELQHASDSKHCRRCGHAYAYEAAYLAHLGRYACPNCGARRPDPQVSASEVELRGIRSAAFTLTAPEGTRRIELPLPGLYNVYNALGAAALCLRLGVTLDEVAAGLTAVAPAFGRAERIQLGGRPTSILLVKNPAGANEAIRTLVTGGAPKLAVFALNDAIADGRDVSWIWDVDWEPLLAGLERLVVTGERAAEMALRCKYGGFPEDAIELVPSLERALDRGLELTPPGSDLVLLPTYTAMLALQRIVSDRGLARPYWERAA
jgi:UDP-N-acetylmuramyl tripeptide synthase